MKPGSYNSRARIAEKAAARERDQQAVARGEKSVEALRRENGLLSFPKDRVRINYRGAKSFI